MNVERLGAEGAFLMCDLAFGRGHRPHHGFAPCVPWCAPLRYSVDENACDQVMFE
jgi:hypothetical protein